MKSPHSSDLIIKVNEQDESLGLIDKYEAHVKGILHRAFSVFVFRFYGFSYQLLLQQRAFNKYHSGGLWSNTCCSHAYKNDNLESLAKIRLEEEMGFSCELYKAGVFHYQAEVGNGLIENEIDHVFVGFHNPAIIKPNPLEVQNYKWVNINELLKLQHERKEEFTIWFPQAFNKSLLFLKNTKNIDL